MELKEYQLFKKIRKLFFFLKYFKIPLIGYVNPTITKLSDDEVEVIIRLRRRTRNHLNSMYFGALAVGADITAGIHAFYFAEKHKKKVSFAFKSMESQFLMRAETDIIFSTSEGKLLELAVLKSAETGERVNQAINVIAKNTLNETVATFVMVSSVKCK